MRAAALALLLLAALAAPAGAQDVRLRGLDGTTAALELEPAALLLGDRVVAAGTAGVFASPLTGGRPQRLAELPELGPAENDPTDGGGFVRIEAADAGRVALASGGGSSLRPEADAARRPVLLGPPAGPFADPAPCGERSGRPVALAGDLVAYVATPDAAVRCAGGASAPVTAPAVVVRDLAADGALVTSVPVSGRARVRGVQLRPGAVAVDLLVRRTRDTDEDDVPSRVHVHRLDGTPLTVTPAVRAPLWTLGEDGTVVTVRSHFSYTPPCLLPGTDARVHPPGDRGGRPLGEHLCAVGSVRLDGGRLRFAARRPDGRSDIVERDLASGARRVLATVAGTLFDADDRTLLVTDDTCSTTDVRILPAQPATPAPPAGPRRCPVRVEVPRRLLLRPGARFVARTTCRLGCVASFSTGEVADVVHQLRPGRTNVFGYAPTRRERRRGRIGLLVSVANPVGPATKIRRTVRLVQPRR